MSCGSCSFDDREIRSNVRPSHKYERRFGRWRSQTEETYTDNSNNKNSGLTIGNATPTQPSSCYHRQQARNWAIAQPVQLSTSRVEDQNKPVRLGKSSVFSSHVLGKTRKILVKSSLQVGTHGNQDEQRHSLKPD